MQEKHRGEEVKEDLCLLLSPPPLSSSSLSPPLSLLPPLSSSSLLSPPPIVSHFSAGTRCVFSVEAVAQRA